MKPASIKRFVSALLIIVALHLCVSPVQAQSDLPLYLIIAPDEFQDALIPFIDLKTSQGFQTDLALLSETGSTNTEIWNFISNYTPQPDYVLLAGDTDLIPAGTIDTDPVKLSACPNNTREWTDLYYTIVDNGCDAVHPLILGRLPVHDSVQLTALVNKYLAFDAAPLDSAWRDKLAFVASDDPIFYSDYETTHNLVIKDRSIPRGFTGTFTRTGAPIAGGDQLYPKTYSARRPDLLEALNQGRLAVMYYGPGSGTSWKWRNLDHFTTADVAALTGPPVPLVLALAPGSADFQVATSMADAWLNHSTGGGALVYIGSSFDPDNNDGGKWLEILFWQELLANQNGTTSIGKALHVALEKFPDLYPDSNVSRKYWEAYQILGDPSLLIIPCQCGRLWSPQDTYRGELGQEIQIPVRLTNLDIMPRNFSLSLSAPAAFAALLSDVIVSDLAPGESLEFYINGVIPLDIPSSSGDITVKADSGVVVSELVLHVEANLQRVYLPVIQR